MLYFNLCTLPSVISLSTPQLSLSSSLSSFTHLLYSTYSDIIYTYNQKAPPEPSRLQVEQLQLFQPLLVWQTLLFLIISCHFTGRSPVAPCLFCTGEPRSELISPSVPFVASSVLYGGEGSPPSTHWQHYSSHSAGCSWPSLLKGHTTGSLSACIDQNLHVVFWKAALQTAGPTRVLVHAHVIPLQVLGSVSIHRFLQPVEIPLGWQHDPLVYHPLLQFCVSSKLAESALCPINQVINEENKQDSVQPLGVLY